MGFLADITEAGKPQPFTLTTMGGRVIYIRQMTARQVAQWWVWVYENPKQRKLYDEQLVELFRRLACDADGKDLVSNEEAGKLREQSGTGSVLSEFWTEAKHRNFLYQTADEEGLERNRFFIQKASMTPAKTPSDALPETPDVGTGSASPTK